MSMLGVVGVSALEGLSAAEPLAHGRASIAGRGEFALCDRSVTIRNDR
jgi:hypothetical protein